MTVLTTSAGQLAARSTSRAAGFRVELLRDGKWVKRERSARRPIDFTLDKAQPGKLVDLPKDLAKAA